MHIFTFDSYHRSALGAATVVLALSSALFAAPLSADDEIPVDSNPKTSLRKSLYVPTRCLGKALPKAPFRLPIMIWPEISPQIWVTFSTSSRAFTLPALVLRLAAQSFRDWEALEFR